MTREEKYEKIKDKGAEIMSLLQMSKAAAKSHQPEKELDYVTRAYKEACNLVRDYPDFEASFVVFAGAGSQLFRLYNNGKMYEEAININTQMLLKMRLLSKHLDLERSCTLFTATANESVVNFLEICDMNSFFDTIPMVVIEILGLQYEILYILKEELKKIKPSSLMFLPINRTLKLCRKKGASHDETLSVSNINGLVNKLAGKMDDFINYL